MKGTGIFEILLSEDGFKSGCPETKFEIIISSGQFEKVTVQKSIVELWIVISKQMITYRLPHMRFDQISDHKHDIHF